jgi:hypothetical protein
MGGWLARSAACGPLPGATPVCFLGGGGAHIVAILAPLIAPMIP